MASEAKRPVRKAEEPCAELERQLKARDAELREAREQQTATAEILKVISSSPADSKPVFDVILENATRLCDSHLAMLGTFDGEKFQVVAAHGINSDTTKYMLDRGPYQPNPGGVLEQMLRDGQPIHTADMRETQGYKNRRPMQTRMVEQDGARTRLGVPMIKDGRIVGSIAIYRPEVRPFTEKQIELVRTFASQAVIAIENVRLFKELQARNAEITEALEQQTATAEILKVICSSPTDTQPVFEAIIGNALRLCDAPTGGLQLYDAEHLRRVATRGLSPEFSRWLLKTRSHLHRPPAGEADWPPNSSPYTWWTDGNPALEGHLEAVSVVDLNGVRTSLFVPMLKEGRLIGAIIVNRREVRAFTDKQIALL
jgi:GAF domain-containing protein